MPYPTVKQLQCLVALDESRHFGRAAQACRLSQSAFSIAIRTLEERLGTALVDRTSRRVTLTGTGRLVADQARICLQDLEVLVGLVEEHRGPLAGALTLGVIPTIAPFLLPRILPGLQQRFPQMRLYLREEKTRLLHEQLLAGHLDLVLLALPYELPGVETMTLFDDSFRLVATAHSHWLDGIQAPVDVSQLPSSSILLLDDGHCLRDHALQSCHLQGAEQISRFAATSLPTLLQMVASDLGVTFVPEMASSSSMVAGAGLLCLEIVPPAGRRIGLAWRRGAGRRDAFEMFGRALCEIWRTP